jgi:hypothetical protein
MLLLQIALSAPIIGPQKATLSAPIIGPQKATLSAILLAIFYAVEIGE